MNYSHLKISAQKAERILLQLYDIQGIASSLPGEVDFNFKIKRENEDGYVLKISRPDEDENYLDLHQRILQFIEAGNTDLIVPKVITDKNGNAISSFIDDSGIKRMVRLLTWISGRTCNSVNPKLDSLRFSLGAQCGRVTTVLQGFDHRKIHRESDWDIAQALWTKTRTNIFDDEKREFIEYFQNQFEGRLEGYNSMRKSVIHNDANDYNVIVSSHLINPKVIALIDYGDAIHTQIINDVAITCAYAIMNHNDPLEAALPIVKGYHSTFPLTEEELSHLYNAIAMRLVISVTKSALNKIKEPDNEYLLISEKPAWELLNKWRLISEDFAWYSFRQACGFSAHPDHDTFKIWAGKNSIEVSELFPTVNRNNVHHIDLSVSGKWIGHEKEFNDLEYFQFKIDRLQSEHPNTVIAGGYLEPRSVYTSTEYDKTGNSGRESRTIHLGIDFWLPAHTPVHALFDGEIVTAVNDAGDKEYGGLVILKHSVSDLQFYTLYGHNTVASALRHKVGDIIKKGDKIAELGNYPENGNWAPHLHFQVMLSMLNYKIDFPGVAYHDQIKVWKSICPDPNLLFKSEGLKPNAHMSNEDLITYRKQHLGKSLSLQYNVPINMVRGVGPYLMDQYARKYLDTVNNVAHVGHEPYNVVKVGQQQMALLNTNSRYLHENINALAAELIETLPQELNVLHFVNSGSEANELAIRMVKFCTGQRDIIASEAGYHGNSNMCVDISSYKFDGKGGTGAPEHTHIFPLPDAFRGKYRGIHTGEHYAQEVQSYC